MDLKSPGTVCFKDYRLIFCFIAFVLAIPLVKLYWTRTTIYFDDDWFPFNPVAQIYQNSYSWQSNNGGSSTGGISSFYISYWYYVLIEIFRLQDWAAQFLTTFTLALIGTLSVFLIARQIHELVVPRPRYRTLVSVFGSLFYMLNPISMSVVFSSHLQSLPFCFAFYPAFFYSFMKSMSCKGKQGLVYSMLAGLSLYLSLFSSVKVWITAMSLAIFLISWAVFIHGKFGKINTPSLFLFLITFAPLFLALFYSTVAAYGPYTGQFYNPSSWSTLEGIFLLRNSGATILNVFRLWGMNVIYEPWYVPGSRYLETFINTVHALTFNYLILFIPFLYVTFAILIKNVRVKRSYYFFYVLLCLLLVLISVVHGPLAWIFLTLLPKFPVLYVYDDPWYASGIFYVFILSILISLSSTIYLEARKRRIHNIIVLVLVVVFMTSQYAVLLSGSYVPSGNVYNAKFQIPSYVNQAVEYVNSLPSGGKVLVFPTIPGRVTYNWSHPFFGKSIFFRLLNKDVFANDFPNGNLLVPLIAKLQSPSIISNEQLFLLGRGINAVTVPRDLFYSSPDFLQASYTILTGQTGMYEIRFEGSPVGHVGYNIYNRTNVVATRDVRSDAGTLNLDVLLSRGLLIEPLVFRDSNVSLIEVRLHSVNGTTVNLGKQYCNILRLLGVRWVITDDITWNPLIDFRMPDLKFVESQLQACTSSVKEFNSMKVFQINGTFPEVYTANRIIASNYSDFTSLFGSLALIGPNSSESVIVDTENIQHIGTTNIGSAEFSYTRLSPTHYKLNVSLQRGDATIVVLNENFDDGWKAYIVVNGTRAQVPPTYHIKVNGFSNGWYIKQGGNYTVELYYQPEEAYRFSFSLSNIFLVVVALLLFLLLFLSLTKKLMLG